jgi:hypothetical protein
MSALAEDDKRLRFMPFDVATTAPAGLIEHFKDRWWCVHPDKGIIWWSRSPQSSTPGEWSPLCNSSEACADASRLSMVPWAELRFFPSVFRRIRPQDYVS